MTQVYVESSYPKRQWTNLESCVNDLLQPYPGSYDCQGELEDMRESIVYMRDCLSRFMARTALTTDDLELIFYASIELVESPDE